METTKEYNKNPKIAEVEKAFDEFLDTAKVEDILNLMTNYGYEYSLTNSIHLWIQAESRKEEEKAKVAFMFNSYKTWQENYNYQVLKGSKGYKIRVPVFRNKKDKDGNLVKNKEGNPVKYLAYFSWGTTFDISQTSGYEKYLADKSERESLIYSGRDIPWEVALQVLTQAQADGVVSTADTSKTDTKYRGYYRPSDKSIGIGKDGDGSTLIHEIGHAYTIPTICHGKAYAYGEIVAEIFHSQFSNALGYNHNKAYAQIWSSRIKDHMTFADFRKAWNYCKDIIKRITDTISIGAETAAA